MKIKNLLVILGEHKSIFSEILSKYFKSYEFKKNKIKFILIGNLRYFKNELSKLKYKFYIKKIKNSNWVLNDLIKNASKNWNCESWFF